MALQIQKLLVPHDFSDAAAKALQYAIDLAAKVGASVVVVHAWQLSAYASPSSELAKGMERDLSRDLAAAIKKAQRGTVKVEKQLRLGVPYVEIVTAAKELGADMIVMGTTGKTGLEHFLLGSVAERIVRTARGRVVVVPLRPDGAAAAAPVVRRILCAVDFSEGSEAALREAVALAERADARITAVHCCAPSPYSSLGPAISSALERELQAELAGVVHRYAARRAPIDTILRHGVPYVEIVATAEEISADLIVVGTAGRTGLAHLLLGSVAERVVRTSRVPVMAVHAPEGS